MASYIVDDRLQGFRIRVDECQFIPIKVREVTEGKLKGGFEENRLGYCGSVGVALRLIISEMLAAKDKDYNMDDIFKLYRELITLEKEFVAGIIPLYKQDPVKWVGK